MKMRILAIMFVAIAVGARCRSITLANVRDTGKESAECVGARRSARVHRDASQDAPSSIRKESVVSRDSTNSTGERTVLNTTTEQLRDLVTSYEKSFAKLVEHAKRTGGNRTDRQREIKSLSQLRSLIEHFVKEQSKVRSMYVKLDNVTDSIFQASSDKPAIRSVENLKDLLDTVKELDIVYQDGEITDEHIRIKRAAEVHKGAFAMSDEKQINNLLVDAREHLRQVRKILQVLCQKHHTTPLVTSDADSGDGASSVDQPSKASTARDEHAED